MTLILTADEMRYLLALIAQSLPTKDGNSANLMVAVLQDKLSGVLANMHKDRVLHA